MFKPQMKFQKILFLVLLLFSAVVFIYGLGLMTDLYGLYQVQAIGGIKGSKIFTDMQPYNNLLIVLAIVCILASVVPFIAGSNTRRKYYIGNLVATIIQCGAYAVTSILILINTIKFRTQFLTTIDFEAYKTIAEKMKFNYSDSTFFFDAGFVIAILLLVAVGAIIYNYNWKAKIVKQENELLKGETE